MSQSMVQDRPSAATTVSSVPKAFVDGMRDVTLDPTTRYRPNEFCKEQKRRGALQII